MSIRVIANQHEVLDVTFLTFSGGERHVQLPGTSQSTVRQIDLSARLQSATDIMDLLLLVNALRHKFGADMVINITLPYLPYARQDRVCAEGQAFSLDVFAGLLNSMEFSNITVWDCHSQVGINLTRAKNITPEKIIAASPALVTLLQSANSVLVCPDNGAKARCSAIKAFFDLPSMIQCTKQRDPSTGKITQTTVDVDSLVGKTAIITDDICDGGFTFIKIAEQLKAKGAEKIVLYVTHGIFSKGVEVFDGLIDDIYTSNSIERTVVSPKINVIQY
ncbi:Ribose-phosphate pyrophosphokinase [Marinomonas spartinae]|uniref:Ribose-phosphate pyrophosphokinase n=1 Tax=Marinomonas spartinae TaxID=1792290 RepID=A0A1A8T7C3_9GAMM|nr:ribose-phosphate diphosphokinase [Marinomonas spartinae]SBS28147.1 Ribose-phosphate pyrophosphokinase [Marinomonas spartinae]SBS28519.1 Ribose-phosphate pyrophosphokinase [Marinomonas spartinae]